MICGRTSSASGLIGTSGHGDESHAISVPAGTFHVREAAAGPGAAEARSSRQTIPACVRKPPTHDLPD
jgi:hypothetical protein